MKSSTSDKTILYLIGGFTLLILVLIGFVAWGESRNASGAGRITQYQVADSDKPVAAVNLTNKDIGKILVSEEKTTDFILTNTGKKPLELYNIGSSCGCTAGQITINGVKSPEASMHGKNSWIGTLNPNQTATVAVIYRPSLMPVRGDVSRSVTVETNDPNNKKLTFTIKTFVE